MDRSIRDLARGIYNPPPEAPREELWARIQAARQAAAASADGGAIEPIDPVELGPATDADRTLPAAGDPDVIDIRSRSARIRRWTFRILPIAALLLLSFGLGRLSLLYYRPRAETPAGRTAVAPAVGEARTGTGALPATTPPAAGAAAPAPAQPLPGAGETRAPVSTGRSRLATTGAPLPRSAAVLPPTAAARRASIYRLAAAQTLGQAEMLLTSFRAETRAGGTLDPQIVTWAGDVLSSTRLLLDSPAGRDPRLRPLLEDLELVLAQIVQLRAAPAGATGSDADLIDNALQQRDIMPRLRTAVPAGASI